ncbi:MAG: hypothetical protein ACOCZ2_04725 [Thermodesulfobacteriota bacterium]
MENSLQKIAEQLDALDEASLTGLWEKYHNIVREFEPTKRWEEAALILSMIQAVRWKNQLFNTKWAELETPWAGEGEGEDFDNEARTGEKNTTESSGSGEKGKVISFWRNKDNS